MALLLFQVLTVLVLVGALFAKKSDRFGSIYRPGIPPTSRYRHQRHRDLPLGRTQFTCGNLHLLLRKKQELTKVISNRIKDLTTNIQPSSEPPPNIKEVEFKTRVLRLYQSELNASEDALNVVLSSLNQTLYSDYTSLDIIRLSCESRLSKMQAVALLVEGNHNQALKLVQEAKSTGQNSSQAHHNLVGDILSEISNAADKLEHQLKDESFHDLVQGKGGGGTEIETVVKIKGSHDPSDQSEEEQALLVDSLSNRYSLSRPRDITVLIDDPYLVRDIVLLVVLCSLFGTLCCLMGVPTLFGFGVAGMILGPAGYNIIKCVVQVETIGQFGAVFIIFVAGLGFSLDKLKKVFRFSMYAAGLLLIVFVVLTLMIGVPLGMQMKQCVFVAVCLSLSSGTLVKYLVEVITSSSKKRSMSVETISAMSSLEEPESSLVSSLQGLLVIQDVQMASLVALMPFFASSPSNELTNFMNYFTNLMKLIQILLGFFLLLLLTHVLAQRVLQPTFKLLTVVKNKDETVLFGSLTICFLLLAILVHLRTFRQQGGLVSLLLGASLELGCFLAGVAISTLGTSVVDQIKKLIEPIKGLFSAIFFASVGFQVFPTFLISEFWTIFSVTFCVVVFKFLTNLVLVGFKAGYFRQVTWLASFFMAHVSEFAFVLCSRGRRMSIITRETYLVLLSVTALSLILSPILWRLPYLVSSIRKPPQVVVHSGGLIVRCFSHLVSCLVSKQRHILSQSKLNA